MENQTEVIVKPDFKLLHLLEFCVNIEKRFAELYRFFAELFIENPEIYALWNKTAHEEDNHAEQFKLAIRLRGNGMATVKVDHAKIKSITEKLDTLLPKFKKSDPTVKQALKFAIQLEEKLAGYHMSVLVDFSDSDLAKLFKAMAKSDIGHIEMLQQALTKLQSQHDLRPDESGQDNEFDDKNGIKIE